MADISKVKLPNNDTVYNIKDATATHITGTKTDGHLGEISGNDIVDSGLEASKLVTVDDSTLPGSTLPDAIWGKIQGTLENQTDLQDALDEKGTYSKPTGGIPASDLAETYIQTSAKGSNNGVAELDDSGKVPSGQLPSYVDDVLEYDTRNDFPATGESGKIYIAKDTNITYRWSGSTYVPIGSDLALGETSTTAYRGDRGKTAYDHSQDSSVHVTTAQKDAWTAKQDAISDLTDIRSGASAGATAYQKPVNGIPARDIATGVIPDISEKENKGKMTISGTERTVVTHILSITDSGITTNYTLLGV